MANGVTQRDFSAKAIYGEADNGSGQKAPGRESETARLNSDSSGSISSNAEQPSAAPDVPGLTSPKGARRILIVDDEAAIADTLALIFKMQHYDAHVAYSAEQAIELIAAWRPDLAILDVMLPEMNGIDLAIVLKANHSQCHVILFSGHANTTMLLEEACRKGHKFEVLAKPVHPNLMLERASELLAGKDESRYD